MTTKNNVLCITKFCDHYAFNTTVEARKTVLTPINHRVKSLYGINYKTITCDPIKMASNIGYYSDKSWCVNNE